MQIFVLGMHRSGTSAITRIINMMGADLGPAQLIGEPAVDNQKGFWERTDVSALNDKLLAGIDCLWDDLANFSADQLFPNVADELRQQLKRIVFQMDTHRPWVLKDPRLCLTFPAWRTELEVPVCVLPYRSPLAIARSLQARNGLSLMQGLALWERYTLAGLSASSGLPRLVVSYERIIQEPVEVVRGLYDFLTAVEVGGLRMPSVREIKAFVDKRLQHQGGEPADLDGILNVAQRRLADAMEDGTVLDWAEVPTLSLGAGEVLAGVREGRKRGIESEAFLIHARAELTETRTSLEHAHQEVAVLGQELDQFRIKTSQMEQELAVLNHAQAELTETRTSLERAKQELDAAHLDATTQEKRIANYVEAMKMAQIETAELDRQVTEEQARAKELDMRVMGLTAQVAQLSGWLAEVDKGVAATLVSWRWRLGNHAVRGIEQLLLRSKPQLALNQVSNVLRQFQVWRQRQDAVEHGALGLSKSPGESRRRVASAEPDNEYSRIDKSECALLGYEILCLPIINWDFRFQRPQQLARKFVQAGHRVYYVGINFSNTLGQHEIEQGVTGLTLPGRESTNVYQDLPTPLEVDNLVAAILEAMALSDRTLWACMVQLPYWEPVATLLRERTGCVIVYDCMDDHAGFSTNAPKMLEAEERLLKAADLVVASSQVLFDKLAPLARRLLLVRNAVDYPHFAVVGATNHKPMQQLTLGYYGAIADWFDSDLVAALARLRPGWHFVLIGNTFSADLNPFKDRTNIVLPGEQPYASLPSLMADWDCCIIPFKRQPLTEATNPVKVYEMLAAGKPVVAVPLPELLPIAATGEFALAETAEAFAQAVESEVSRDSAQRRAARRAFAKANTWELRQRDLEAGISDCVPLVSILIVTFNNLELTRQCLESVLGDTDYPRYEVIVVDNASEDGTTELLRNLATRDSRMQVIFNAHNQGFASANNQALAIAAGEYLCLLNNDTVVSGAWLSTLVRHLRRNPNVGLIGPNTNACGNDAQIPVGYDLVTDMPLWAAEHCRRHRGELADIKMLAFFCVVMPRQVYRTVGPLDERFAIGMFEDDDYNDRVRAAGFKVKLAHDSFIHHWQRASFKLLGEDEYHRIYRENQDRYQNNALLSTRRRQALAKLKQACLAAGAVVLFPPSIGWNVTLFQRPHHLARAVAAMGGVAIFDCTGSSVDEVDLLREAEPGVYLFQGSPSLLRDLPALILWCFTYNYGYRDYFLTGVRVVYDWIDDLSVFPYDQGWLGALHARALREADVVAAVARNLHADLLNVRKDALYLPNAVDARHFREPPSPNPASQDTEMKKILAAGKPIAGYYGALARWFDYELLKQVAGQRVDWSFVLIGPDLDGSLCPSGITDLANVHWLGTRDYARLPGYLHLFDVALIPFKINEITRATSPLKLFEYFAGGRGVVTTPMPECAAFEEVLVAETAQEFSAALDRAVNLQHDANYLARLNDLANANSWEARVRMVLSPGDYPPRPEKNAKNPGDSGISTIPSKSAEEKVASSFQHLLTERNEHFFTALTRHFADLYENPCLPMYFQFALSANDRGRAVVRILETRLNLKGKRYLDVGCAYGGFLVAFYEAGCEPSGIDLEPRLLGLARENFRDFGVNFNVSCGDITKPDEMAGFEGGFDIVTCNDVIEHVRDPAVTIRHIAAILSKNGVAYFEIPNRDAAEFVISDGHYQLFGITQLDREEAMAYYAEQFPGGSYGVEYYLRLAEYRSMFDAAGFDIEIMEETLEGISFAQTRSSVARLEDYLSEGIGRVPPLTRQAVEEAVHAYLKRANDFIGDSPENIKDYLLTYGAAFWKILARKR